MTEILFVSFLMVFGGYIIGKLFVRLNPFFMIFGFVLIFSMAPILIEIDNDYYTACLVLGGLLNFSRPVSYVRNLFYSLSLMRLGHRYTANIEEQKQQAEAELYSQKNQVEEELRRQKEGAEQDIQQQRKEAEEAIKREAENLQREKERYSRQQQDDKQRQQKEKRQRQQNNKQQSDKNNESDNQSSHSQNNKKAYLNPLIFADACEIFGLSQGKALKEYKRAYIKLMKLYHSDRLAGLSEELRKQEEEKAKTLNVAMGTIKKKFR